MRLLREWAKDTGVKLPEPGHYAVAMCFLPREAKAREIVVKQFEHFIKVEGQMLLGWRDVPTDPAGLGKTVLDQMPLIRQAIIGDGPASSRTRMRSSASCSPSASRPRIRWPIWPRSTSSRPSPQLYMPSFSTRTVVYKGLLLAHDVGRFYRDLHESADHFGDRAGASALLHQHVPKLEAGASLSASSPTMAKSTPCAATSTG